MFKQLILITYINRSGSTLLLNLFSRDSHYATCLEAEILIDFLLSKPHAILDENFEAILSALRKDRKLREWALPEKILSINGLIKTRFDLFIHILNQYKELILPQAEIVCFKGTKGYVNFEDVKTLCLSKGIKCDLVRIIRDPRGVFASQRKTISPTTHRLMSINPLDVARSWNDWIKSTSNISNVKSIKYEALIGGGEDVFGALCQELGVDFKISSPTGTLFSKLPTAHKLIHSNIEKPFIPEKIGMWSKEIGSYSTSIIENECRGNMILFGYSAINRPIKNRLFYIIYRLWLRMLSKKKFIAKKVRFTSVKGGKILH